MEPIASGGSFEGRDQNLVCLSLLDIYDFLIIRVFIIYICPLLFFFSFFFLEMTSLFERERYNLLVCLVCLLTELKKVTNIGARIGSSIPRYSIFHLKTRP